MIPRGVFRDGPDVSADVAVDAYRKVLDVHRVEHPANGQPHEGRPWPAFGQDWR
jgi:hypothetical protein